MAKGQQRGKISQLMDSNAAWARAKTHRPKYVLHVPDNDSILELQYMDMETMWKEAKQIFESKKTAIYGCSISKRKRLFKLAQ